MARKDQLTPGTKRLTAREVAQRKSLFLAAIEETGRPTTALVATGLARKTMYGYRRDDPEFAAAWDEAQDRAVDALQDEAWRRAHEGVEEPVFYRGEKVATVRKYSDTLLMFLLNGLRPERFKYRGQLDVNADVSVRAILDTVDGASRAGPAGG